MLALLFNLPTHVLFFRPKVSPAYIESNQFCWGYQPNSDSAENKFQRQQKPLHLSNFLTTEN
jgi:hypothetical protein